MVHQTLNCRPQILDPSPLYVPWRPVFLFCAINHKNLLLKILSKYINLKEVFKKN